MKSWLQSVGASVVLVISTTVNAETMATPETPGIIEVTGYGSSSAQPELVRIGLRIVSRCHLSSKSANEANAILANQLIEILRNHMEINQPVDSQPESHTQLSEDEESLKIITHIGTNLRQDETLGYGQNARTLCRQKWRATLSIDAGILDYQRLAELQDVIFARVDDYQSRFSVESEPQTWADFAVPRFDVLPSTLERLKKEAQLRALQNAREKISAFDSICGFSDLKLSKASEPSFTSSADSEKRIYTSADNVSAETPVMPGAVEVRSRWDFIWTYDNSAPAGGHRQCLSGS